MSYIDGFVLAVPTANREKYEQVAGKFDAMLIQHGALRVVEAWGDDVPHGKRTDFYRATEATAEEAIVFSWAEWPDKATRDRAHAAMEKLMSPGSTGQDGTGQDSKTQNREPMGMPFDGARMISGGFATILSLGASA